MRAKVLFAMGCLVLVLGVTCGICIDLGLIGTAWACGSLAVVCLVFSPAAVEMAGQV